MFIWSKNTKKSFCARQLNPVSHGFHTDRCQNEEKYKIQNLKEIQSLLVLGGDKLNPVSHGFHVDLFKIQEKY